jgi:copper chaperone CopZ
MNKLNQYVEEDMTKTYKLQGLDCADCLAKMERKISKLKGVKSVTSNFFTEKMIIEAEDGFMPEIEEAALKIIKKYEPQVVFEEA